MSDFNLYFPLENQLEGITYEDVPGDSGGCTKYGLTLSDLKEFYKTSKTCVDVKNMTRQEAATVLRKLYWDYFGADHIPNDSLAQFIVDSGLNQGKILIAEYLQKIIGVKEDGLFGQQSLQALLTHSPADVFKGLYDMRKKRYDEIVAKNSSQEKFYKGWMNRLNAIKFVQ